MSLIFREFKLIDENVDRTAEVHGLLCGLLCADETLSMEQWLEQIDQADAQEALRDSLIQLFDATLAELNDEDLEFNLLLPDEHTRLWARTESLARWCQGFLSGLGLGGLSGRQTPDVQEFILDLSHIAQVKFDGAGEENETAYTEIVEYIRVGVMLLKQTLRSTRTAYPAALH